MKPFPPQPPLPRHRREQGFSLVEVTLSLGIMAFCLVPIFGVLPVGISSNQATLSQTRASCVAANLMSDVRGKLLAPTGSAAATPATLSARFKVDMTRTDAQTVYFSETGNAGTDTIAADSRYRATITVKPGTAPSATWLNVLVTWPAGAAITNPSGKYVSATAINQS